MTRIRPSKRRSRMQGVSRLTPADVAGIGAIDALGRSLARQARATAIVRMKIEKNSIRPRDAGLSSLSG